MTGYILAHTHELDSPLTPEAFMRGIEDFSRRPHVYIDGLEQSEILEEKQVAERKFFRRRLCFGKFSFEDMVTLSDKMGFVEQIPAVGEISASLFIICFKKLSRDRIRVRFTYREDANVQLPEFVKKLRQEAWVAKDRGLLEKIEAMCCCNGIE